MTQNPKEWEGGVLRAVVRRLLGSEHWCESWAHGCSLDSSLAVHERAPLLQLAPVRAARPDKR
jgi:hypothetical protein